MRDLVEQLSTGLLLLSDAANDSLPTGRTGTVGA
jgi:hypothetical protein